MPDRAAILTKLRRLKALKAKRAAQAKECPVVYDLIVNAIQDRFLKSQAKQAWAIGGNQAGKTFICVVFLLQKTGFYTKYRVRRFDPSGPAWIVGRQKSLYRFRCRVWKMT